MSLRILVTNDDGIHARGLQSAEQVARALSDDVWIVAPETEQSGASHSFTLSQPLRLRQVEERKFAVSGTPTDCILMASAYVLKDRQPDLVLSGVNRGANVADDVTYSGTVAGAMEGSTLGVPAIALSQSYAHHDREEVRWECAETHGPALVRRLLAAGWPDGVLMNVNFPDCPPDKVRGIAAVAQAKRDIQEAILDRRIDARGYPYFWIGFKRERDSALEGTDLWALARNYITITPLHLNLTEDAVLSRLRRQLAP